MNDKLEEKSQMPEDSSGTTSVRKIVYFDEGSAADYIQIVNGGQLKATTELLNEDLDSGGAGVEGKARVSAGGIMQMLGFGASVAVDGSLETSFNSGSIAKSIITNTILTDFLEVVDEENNDIKHIDGFSIEPIKNSLTSFALMTPYFAMVRGGAIPAGEFNIAVEKLDSTLKSAKGYFEFLGTKGNERIILRFNNSAFKNNYRAQDLLRMNLVVYAVLVGESSLKALDMNEELHVDATEAKDNPDYREDNTADTIDDTSLDLLKMYDVLLAGVKSCD